MIRTYLQNQDDYFKAIDKHLMVNKLKLENSEVFSCLLSIMHNPQNSNVMLTVFEALIGGIPDTSSVGSDGDSNGFR